MQNSKEIGNRFERNIAKELSLWIFNDPHTLKREPTSGATKNIYVGDIFPMKQINWGVWPFMIECKYGYTQFTPTLLNYSIIEKWYLKSFKEAQEKNNGQEIVLLICNFKNKKGILLCTNTLLNRNIIDYNCILNVKDKKINHYVYCYDYKKILKYNFESVFS